MVSLKDIISLPVIICCLTALATFKAQSPEALLGELVLHFFLNPLFCTWKNAPKRQLQLGWPDFSPWWTRPPCITGFFLQRDKMFYIPVHMCTQCAQQWVGSLCIFHEKEILHFLFEILDRLIFEEFYSKVLSILNEKIIIWNLWLIISKIVGVKCVKVLPSSKTPWFILILFS